MPQNVGKENYRRMTNDVGITMGYQPLQIGAEIAIQILTQPKLNAQNLVAHSCRGDIFLFKSRLLYIYITYICVWQIIPMWYLCVIGNMHIKYCTNWCMEIDTKSMCTSKTIMGLRIGMPKIYSNAIWISVAICGSQTITNCMCIYTCKQSATARIYIYMMYLWIRVHLDHLDKIWIYITWSLASGISICQSSAQVFKKYLTWCHLLMLEPIVS